MATTILDVTRKIAEFQQAQIKKALDSISQLGIVPLAQVNIQGYTPNFVIGSEATQNSTCVNYLNLAECTAAVTEKDVIHEAVWEEYTGVFGISMERAWSFSFQKNSLLTVQEICSRFCTNIVFVVQPPMKKGIATPVTEGEGAMMQCYYEVPVRIGVGHDGFSRSRGESLDCAPKKVVSQLTEIKTSHTFGKQEIIAVLVPEALYEYHSKELSEYFPGKIIKVSDTIKPINKLPDILQIMHGESITRDTLQLRVPDYEGVLANQIAKRHKKFSLHAVRLHTVFDFTPRFIHNLAKSSGLLEKANACILKENKNGSAWVLVHQAKVFDAKKTKSFRSLSGVLSGRFDTTFFREAFLKAKGEMLSSRFLTDEHQPTKTHHLQKGIESLVEVDAIQFDYDRLVQGLPSHSKILLLSYPPCCKSNIDVKGLENRGQALIAKEIEVKTNQEAEKKVIEEKREKSAIVIQTIARKYLNKKLCSEHEIALKRYEEAQAALRGAEQNLTDITAKLNRRAALRQHC
jgi:hypothetical protein